MEDCSLFPKTPQLKIIIIVDYLEFDFLADGCWGDFFEGINSYTLNFNCQCTPITNIYNNNKSKHAGSTLLAIDVDNDNDRDLILGDVV